MESFEEKSMPKALTKKLVIAVSILLTFSLAIVLFVNLTASKPDVLAETGEGRPTSLPPYTPVKITDPAYAEPTVGTGVSGPPVKEKIMDSRDFESLFLPYIDEPNVPAGTGFNVEAKDLKPGEDFTAVVYPRGSSASNPATVTVGKSKTDSKGKLALVATLPTNLSLGSYTIEVKGPSKTFTTPFVIRP